MRLLLFTDNHFCETSSIVRKFGYKYTERLDNQINSINWLEQLAVDKKCDEVICLGDFFNRPNLTDKELTALRDIKWNNLKHYFIVGNHESGDSELQYSSTKVLESDNRIIISQPTKLQFENCEVCLLPYVVESDKKSIKEYFGSFSKKRLILSHNDIAGIQYGPVISRLGFNIKDIEDNSTLFINGHLHNGTAINNKVINLGNLTGQNFTEDAEKFSHRIMILDTDTFKYEYIENPFAFNFYKIEINNKIDALSLPKLKSNAVVSFSCNADYLDLLEKYINENKNKITEHKKYIYKPVSKIATETDSIIDIVNINHLDKLKEFCKQKIEPSDVLDFELAELCK